MIAVNNVNGATVITFEDLTSDEQKILKEVKKLINGEKKVNPWANFKCNQKKSQQAEMIEKVEKMNEKAVEKLPDDLNLDEFETIINLDDEIPFSQKEM